MRHAPQELRTYFVAASTAGRRRLFQVEANAILMIDTLANYRSQKRFSLHAFVVMPDHLHVLITPAPEIFLEKAVQFVKGGFSFCLKSRREVWDRGYFEKRIPDKNAFEACLSYIHRNPVKAGIAENQDEFAFSSAVRKDLVDPMPDWLDIARG